jgi:hypothetical protein
VTYVIAEPSIDALDRARVDECPAARVLAPLVGSWPPRT